MIFRFSFLILTLLLLPLAVSADAIPEVFRFLGDSETISQSFKTLMSFVFIATVPVIFIMMTSFTRVIIILSFLRQALGLSQLLPYQLLIGLSLVLTFVIMAPSFETIYEKSIDPYTKQNISQAEAFRRGFEPMKAFMLKQTKESDIQFFQKLRKSEDKKVDDISLLPAFILSELKIAFQIGFVVYIPFLIIDLIVAGLFMAMGMMALSPMILSLPLKVMLFVFIDGWSLLTEALMKSFQ